MSVEAITWALKAQVSPSSAKFILVVMANCADATTNECFPSAGYLAECTSQDRKTVLANIKRLKDAGYLTDTGNRRGETGQVIVYRLNNPENGTVSEQSQKRNGTENGTVPKFPANSTEIPAKQSRFSAETVPKTGHGNVKETKEEPSGKRKKARADGAAINFDAWPEVGPQVLADYLQHRKQLKAPLTQTAADEIGAQLHLAVEQGMTADQALAEAMAAGWRGFRAKWLLNAQGREAGSPAGRPATGLNRQEALEQRNRAVAASWTPPGVTA